MHQTRGNWRERRRSHSGLTAGSTSGLAKYLLTFNEIINLPLNLTALGLLLSFTPEKPRTYKETGSPSGMKLRSKPKHPHRRRRRGLQGAAPKR